MKKITILALHLNYGGIEKYISYLCKMFENDYEVEVLATYKYNDKPAFDFSSKVKINYLTNDYPDKVSIKQLVKNHKYFVVIKEVLRRLKLKYQVYKLNKRTIKKMNTDYIITTRIYHNKLVNKYLKDSKIIKIATEHNYHNDNQKQIKKTIKSTTNFDYFVHCTDELYDYYTPLIKGAKSIKIYNPIHIDNNYKSELNNLNIISVGRLSEEKGYLDLIDVMKEINKLEPKVKLIICGDGHLRGEIENKIKTYGLNNNICLMGFVGGKELEKAYMESSLYVMPSLSEAFGLVLLEAMHYGLPCIAFDSASGARNLLKSNVGILIKNRDIKKMASTIVSLLNSKTQLEKYSSKSIACVKNYSLDKIYKEWKKILK